MTEGTAYESVAGLSVDGAMRRFVEEEVLRRVGLAPEDFWHGLAAIISDLAPRHRELLATRDKLQAQIDHYHRTRKGQPHDAVGYEQFLRDIGYLVPAPAADAYSVATKNVDAEMAVLAGSQLVAPLSDVAAVVKALNARWGSLYDALAEAHGSSRDADRMAGVLAQVYLFLDGAFPLAGGSHADAAAYMVERDRLEIVMEDGSRRRLRSPGQFVGFVGPRHAPRGILLSSNGLHLEVRFDRDHPVGTLNPAGIADVVVEGALSVIMDLDDTVAATDADDKICAYRTWLRVMDGSLDAMAADRTFATPNGGKLVLHGRPVVLVRHVAHHVFTDMVLDGDRNPVPEAIIDAAVTVAVAMADVCGEQAGRNSRSGSIYIVKPKMHGPEEISLADLLFKRIEELVGLPKYTLKLGLMDEERRTSVNLAACMSRVRDRTFLLRTSADERIGDEIRTFTQAGPMPRLEEMARAPWFLAYEANNVDTGIARHLPGRAQIGKGMKCEALRSTTVVASRSALAGAGASSIAVSTPTAAMLQAMRYYLVDVASEQEGLRERPRASLGDLLSPPLAAEVHSPDEVEAELEGNLRRLLALVAAFVGTGACQSSHVSCGTVGLTSGRGLISATSQHVSNWLYHGLVSEAQVRATMRRVAQLLGHQDGNGDGGAPLSRAVVTASLNATERLLFNAGNTLDSVLSHYRREAKAVSV